MKSYDHVYRKILKDLRQYLSERNSNKKLFYQDDDGTEIEASFDYVPTPDEVEGMLIFFNKDKIAHA
jgi:hypothetical protein